MGLLMFAYRISDEYYGTVKASMKSHGYVTA
jgi:GPH family glycoside/pentoside/hexuronide:cation symporter